LITCASLPQSIPVRYTELAPTRFKSLFREKHTIEARMVRKSKCIRGSSNQKRTAAAVSTAPKRDLLEVLIALAVTGGPSPFPIDPNPRYKWKGSFEATFDGGAGDRQILLWAIEDCAQKGESIPPWAAKALHNIMFRGVALAKFASWNEVFGPIRVLQQREIDALQHMVAVWQRVQKLRQEDRSLDYDGLFEEIRKEFPIGIVKLKSFYQKMQKFMREHQQDVQRFMEEHPGYGFDR
jgi:hypothetical protein